MLGYFFSGFITRKGDSPDEQALRYKAYITPKSSYEQNGKAYVDG
jgi:hypothetical protein